jgi:hypothetical protein
MEEMTPLHRKSLIRLMSGDLRRTVRKKQRGRTYGPEVTAAIRVIAASMDYPCAERLTPNLVWMAKHLVDHQELVVSADVLEKLGTISISTVERRLQTIRRDLPRRARKPPQAPNRALKGVPMGRISWDVQEPGHLEVDTVHHCGPSASGEYVHTVQMVDVTTGWSECRAILGRSYANPIRAYLGYDRLDTVDQTLALNALYDKMRLYHNFFQPVMRVAEKTVVSEEGQPTRIRRRYDRARTPFDRLCNAGALSSDAQAELAAQREHTNPLQLLTEIEAQLERIFSLPCRTPDQPENIYDTLSEVPDPRPEPALAR